MPRRCGCPRSPRYAFASPVLWGDVVHIVDGDTCDATLTCCPCVPSFRVRPLGIDAPERGACYFAEATAALGDLVAGRRVARESDHSDRDGWGRLLRWVWVDGVLVNGAMVAQGYAVVDIIGHDDRYAAQLQAAEAQAAQRGGWVVTM